MRKIVLVLASMAAALVMAGGAALALSPLGASAGNGEGQDAASPDGRFSEEQLRKVDEFVAQQMRQQDLPSVVVKVWAPGEGRYSIARGKADLETGLRRELDQPFRIASITKTFTATAVLQLVDEGKLETSDKLAMWYPNFPNAKKITIDDLLRMRSGIPDFTDEEFMRYWYAHPRADITAQDSIQRSAKKVNQFKPPGQETVYANINYVLLQEIVRKVSGDSLGERIEEGILEPLDMDDTSYPNYDVLPSPLLRLQPEPEDGRVPGQDRPQPGRAGRGGGDDLDGL